VCDCDIKGANGIKRRKPKRAPVNSKQRKKKKIKRVINERRLGF
jgi:hypothetical protein